VRTLEEKRAQGRKRQRLYYERHKAVCRAEALERYHAKKHTLDRVKLHAYHKRWSLLNPEKAKKSPEAAKRWRERRLLKYKTDHEYRARVLARCRKHTKENPEVRKRYLLKKKYGLTTQQLEEMRLAQGNKCAICGAGEGYNFPNIDHCHKTKKVRGLLCQKCNHGVGLFKDSPELLRIAAAYLERC
jgi:hypothetical protein